MSECSYHRAKFSFEAHYHGFTGLWFSKYWLQMKITFIQYNRPWNCITLINHDSWNSISIPGNCYFFNLQLFRGIDEYYNIREIRCSGGEDIFWDVMKEGNVLFNDALHTLYLWLYGVKHMVKDIVREETRCRHMGYSWDVMRQRAAICSSKYNMPHVHLAFFI